MKKWITILSSLIGLGMIIVAICVGLVLTKVNDRPSELTGYDTILVLGAQILPNGQPAPITQARLDAALLLAKENPKAKIVVSGAKGSDETISEAQGMANYLENHSVSADRIIKEEKARDTSENLKYSKPYLQGKVIMVTSDFHLYRALYLADKQHLVLTGYAAPTHISSPLLYTGYYGHEVLGLIYAFIFGTG